MPLELEETFTLEEIHKAINVKEEIVSMRTLEDVVRELGFQKGRGKKRLFTRKHAIAIQERVICRIRDFGRPRKARA